MRQRAGTGQLQELAGGRRCFLPTNELYGGPSGLSLASGPGPQSCAALFHRLLAMCQARPRMATQRRKKRSPTTAAPVSIGHGIGLLVSDGTPISLRVACSRNTPLQNAFRRLEEAVREWKRLGLRQEHVAD
jgi:hypothetical protein